VNEKFDRAMLKWFCGEILPIDKILHWDGLDAKHAGPVVGNKKEEEA
jgi:hypothetical protein